MFEELKINYRTSRRSKNCYDLNTSKCNKEEMLDSLWNRIDNLGLITEEVLHIKDMNNIKTPREARLYVGLVKNLCLSYSSKIIVLETSSKAVKECIMAPFLMDITSSVSAEEDSKVYIYKNKMGSIVLDSICKEEKLKKYNTVNSNKLNKLNTVKARLCF